MRMHVNCITLEYSPITGISGTQKVAKYSNTNYVNTCQE